MITGKTHEKNHAFFFVELIENRKGRIIFVAEEFVEGVKSTHCYVTCISQ